MNKKLIAIAIAGAMAAPMAAQAEVSISGLIQTEVVSVSGDQAEAAGTDGLAMVDGMESEKITSGNASGLFFNMSEDLGGGMKAVGKIGMNFQPDNGTGIGARDMYAGIAGGFGTVLAGTMNSPYKASTVKWDPFLTTFMQARGSAGMSGFQNGYASNALAYANNFGNIKFVGALVFDDSNNDDHGMSFSVNVPVGPIEAAVAYMDTGATDDTALKVGAKWNSGPMTVAAQYEMLGDAATGMNTGITPSAIGGDMMFVSGSYGMGNNTVSASFGSYSADTADANGEDSYTYLALGVKHAMSKKVGIHAGYRSTSDIADAVGAGIRVKF